MDSTNCGGPEVNRVWAPGSYLDRTRMNLNYVASLLIGYLPKSGLNQHFPCVVLYGIVDKNGVGLKIIYLIQGINHFCDIFTHLSWQKTITRHFILPCCEQLHLEIGINPQIF